MKDPRIPKGFYFNAARPVTDVSRWADSIEEEAKTYLEKINGDGFDEMAKRLEEDKPKHYLRSIAARRDGH